MLAGGNARINWKCTSLTQDAQYLACLKLPPPDLCLSAREFLAQLELLDLSFAGAWRNNAIKKAITSPDQTGSKVYYQSGNV